MNAAVDYAFLHGGGQGSWVWNEVIAALACQTGGEFGRALALDVPGCGAKRGRLTTTLDMDEITAELIDDIEAAGFRDVVLIGHSQAGTVVPRLLQQRPDLFRHAVYVSCMAPLAGQTALTAIASSYVVCLHDGILPVAWQERFAARLKVSRVLRIDAGHQAMNTRPHGLGEILRHEAAYCPDGIISA